MNTASNESIIKFVAAVLHVDSEILQEIAFVYERDMRWPIDNHCKERRDTFAFVLWRTRLVCPLYC